MVPSVKKQKNIAGSQNKLDLNEVLKILYDKFKVTSIIAECGQTLSSELLENNFIDKFLIFIAPKIIGCDSPFGMFKDLDIIRVSDAVKIKFDSIKKIGEDILINAYPGCGTIF